MSGTIWNATELCECAHDTGEFKSDVEECTHKLNWSTFNQQEHSPFKVAICPRPAGGNYHKYRLWKVCLRFSRFDFSVVSCRGKCPKSESMWGTVECTQQLLTML